MKLKVPFNEKTAGIYETYVRVAERIAARGKESNDAEYKTKSSEAQRSA
jgi:hypothetical protein